ncbi:MAG: gliding motility-associated C-terminal domain-containing protein [Spirochaetales bacterium]|nr:gliding motility-associated C-terminal domain-containing protein [Spirochaetales bacterium]
MNTILTFCVLFAYALLSGCATTPNEITITAQVPEAVYISPKIADGVQDVFEAPVDLTMIRKAPLGGFEITVADLEGTVVYSLSKEAPPKPKGLRGLFAKRTGIETPTVIIWDGKNFENSFVEDGEYQCSMRAWDLKGVEASYGPVAVIVDNTEPWLELSTSYGVFSPDGDGRLDTITINQRSSTDEDQWTGEIFGGTAGIRSFSWEGRAEDFVWDGMGADGRTVSDGTYDYVVGSTDKAGNRGEFSLAGIEVDTSSKNIRLGRSANAFSPNGDGKQDTVNFNPSVVTDKNLEEWKVTVVDETGVPVRVFIGTGSVPTSVVFDGLSDSGEPLPDGGYRGIFKVRYSGGAEPETASPLITLDTSIPIAAVNVDYPLFSPDGDGRRDSLFIRQSTSVETGWKGTIVDEGGKTVREYSWDTRAVATSWDGKDATGKVVPDGRYTYKLTSADEAGNSLESVLSGITVDTRPAKVQVSAVRRAFSPNNDGFFDSITVNMTAAPAEGIKSWSLAMLNRDGQAVKSYERSEETLPASIVWNGFGQTEVAPNGSYTASLKVEYWKGDIAESKSAAFVLDTIGPVLTLELSPKPFSPDGDGNADVANIRLVAQDASGIQDWRVQINDPEGHSFRSFSGLGSSMNPIKWDGRSGSGELVQSASDYTVVFSAWDAVGNISATNGVLPVDILIFREGDQLRIVLSNIYFEPYTTNYLNVPQAEARENLATLDKLAEILKRYPTYKIHVEGHAVRIYWDDPVRGPVEEKEALLPLSLGRAEAIREALVERGVRRDRITVEGFGGTRPVVPHSDLENRWKNRRVEFILGK